MGESQTLDTGGCGNQAQKANALHGGAAPGAWLVALVKPQFEVGRDHIGKGGIVRDEAARERAVAKVRDWIDAQPGWAVTGMIASPIARFTRANNLELSLMLSTCSATMP